MTPVTIRAKEAYALFGVKRDKLNEWVAKKRVIAFCEDKCVFYDYESIANTIKSLPNWEPKERK